MLTERDQLLLKLIVEQYITSGQPVGSKALVEQAQLDISSATIRSVMSALEDQGLLHSPHTSAGRIPTPLGYRFFINSLLTIKPINQQVLEELEHELTPLTDHQLLLKHASQELSRVTAMAGMISLPRPDHWQFRLVEFIRLSPTKVLVILVFNGQEVQNRIIELGEQLTQAQLEMAGNYLTETFAGKSLSEIRQQLLQLIQTERQRLDIEISTLMQMAEQAFHGSDEGGECIIEGHQHLVSIANERGINQLKAVFDAFTEKQALLGLFDKILHADGVQIYIGEESGLTGLVDCSLIAAPYLMDNQKVGVLGVIGPSRMNYQDVIPIVDITAKLLTSALK